MPTLSTYIVHYQKQLQEGSILVAHRALVSFVMQLRTDAIRKYAAQYRFSGILHGYLDYTYFYFTNAFLKTHHLKFGLVLNHVDMRFELWLLGNTKTIQQQYWALLQNSLWIPEHTAMPEFAILETTLVAHPDFDALETLSETIFAQMLRTCDEILTFLENAS